MTLQKDLISAKNNTSVYDINKASILRRLAALLIDFIILVVLATGFASIVSAVVKYDEKYEALEEKYLEYGVISLNPNATDDSNKYISCTIDYDANGNVIQSGACYLSWNKFYNDSDAVKLSSQCDNLMIVILSVSSLIALLLSEFALPLVFKNGQTLGKKVMHIGLIGTDRVAIRKYMLFARVIIGRFAIETLIPIYLIVYAFINPTGGLLGILIIIIIAIAELLCIGITSNNQAIHDLVGGTVVIDMDGQFIAKNKQELEMKMHESTNNR